MLADEGRTASWAGHSIDVLHRNYRGLIKSEDARRFWKILPPSMPKAGKIVSMPAVAA